jgi:hypothetical protein
VLVGCQRYHGQEEALSEFPLHTSAEQPGDIYVIAVRVAEFVSAAKEQWRYYEAEAERLHLHLRVGSVSHGPSEEVLVGRRLANTRRRWSFRAAYDGPIGCKRPRWEHSLRELLELDDPCFGPPPEQPQ